ncbi:leucine-rich repeat domain-containing protein [Paraprevotella clara]|uniref:leucine-rich repeat domain-containing protein n=1 Tax=Paraprevotella clara TaxID=454154 RepID=UPI003AB3D94C
MKKIFLLLWFVLLGLFEVQAYQFEKNGIYYDIVNGKAVVVSGDVSYSGDVVIPDSVEYDDVYLEVDSISEYAFQKSESLSSIVLPKSLTSIGESAFSGCSGLDSISLPEGLTSVESHSFNCCTNLKSVSFPEGLTSIGFGAFNRCGNLTSLVFPASLTSISDNAFNWCSNVDTLSFLGRMDSINWNAFTDGNSANQNIKRVYINDLSTWLNSQRYIDIKIVGYEALSAPEAVLYLDGKLLTDMVVPEGVKEIKPYTFYGMDSIRSVTLPKTLKNIAKSAFENCVSLTSVAFPEGLTGIEDAAFYGCDKLDSLSFPASMKTINWTAFCTHRGNYGDSCSCEHIRYVNVKDLHTWINSERWNYREYDSHTFFPHAQLYLDGTLLTKIVVPEGVEEIKSNTFCGLDSLVYVKLPASIKKLGHSIFNDQGVDVDLYALVPPQLEGDNPFGENLVYVPESSIEAYRTAWSDKVNDILCLGRQHDWNVTVEAEDKSSAVLQAVGGVSDNEAARNVVRLKVSGTVNSYDFMVMRNKMTCLRELDLTDAHVVYNPYEHYQGYHSWNDSLPDYAFYRKDLRVCRLPQNIVYIGRNAFSRCSRLTDMDIPEKVQEIGDAAFEGCNRLENVKFSEGLEFIRSEAFAECALHDTIIFPRTLKHISYSAFRSNGLRAVKFPTGLEQIEGAAFSYCSGLSEVRFPSSVLNVGSDAFGNCDNIKDVYTYIIDPLELDQTTFSAEVFKNATLHVPETAQNNYYWDTQWSQFPSIVMFNEPYEYFYLNKDLVIDEETPRLEGDTIPGTGEVQGPDADLNPGSGLVVEGSESQDLGDVHLKDDGNGNGASVIGQGNKDGHCNIDAKNLHIDIQVEANRWYFFCFPYPIDKKNIKYAGSYVLRWYDGAERAQHGRGGWKDWTADKLTAGVGYIFQGSQSGTLTFKIPDAKFDGENRDILLQSHGADEVQDAGWNFVGNPYTSYFNLQDLGYDYPVTIWNGWSYEAYNPQDDDYVLYPYQAFFVQKPNAEDAITFHAAHRKTKLQSEAARRANVAPRRIRRAAGVERRLVNLTLSDGKVTDKTRVVFNARRREAYEVGCDAAKFMAEGVPQLYSLDGQGVKYAINERPEGNGVVSLGYEVQVAGNYTIGLTRADVGVMLKDKLTGASHDFSEGDYMFSSEVGTFHDRFLLVKSASATGVNGVFAAGEAVVDVENGTIAVSGADGLRTTVTALSGILMGIIDGNGSLDVRPGVYVVNVGGQARKVVVR